MAVVLQRTAVLEPEAGEGGLAGNARDVDGKAHRIARKLKPGLGGHRGRLPFGTTNGRRIEPRLAEDIRSCHQVGAGAAAG